MTDNNEWAAKDSWNKMDLIDFRMSAVGLRVLLGAEGLKDGGHHKEDSVLSLFNG